MTRIPSLPLAISAVLHGLMAEDPLNRARRIGEAIHPVPSIYGAFGLELASRADLHLM